KTLRRLVIDEYEWHANEMSKNATVASEKCDQEHMIRAILLMDADDCRDQRNGYRLSNQRLVNIEWTLVCLIRKPSIFGITLFYFRVSFSDLQEDGFYKEEEAR
ncbi:hypothetical protein ACJX0J_027935, partial [Zea mays]